jgi:hypothetical protein
LLWLGSRRASAAAASPEVYDGDGRTKYGIAAAVRPLPSGMDVESNCTSDSPDKRPLKLPAAPSDGHQPSSAIPYPHRTTPSLLIPSSSPAHGAAATNSTPTSATAAATSPRASARAVSLHNKTKEELITMYRDLEMQKSGLEHDNRQMSSQLGLLKGYLHLVIGQGKTVERALNLAAAPPLPTPGHLTELLLKPSHTRARSADTDPLPGPRHKKPRLKSSNGSSQQLGSAPEINGTTLVLNKIAAPSTSTAAGSNSSDQLQIYRLDVLQGGKLARHLFLPNDAITLAAMPDWSTRDRVPPQVRASLHWAGPRTSCGPIFVARLLTDRGYSSISSKHDAAAATTPYIQCSRTVPTMAACGARCVGHREAWMLNAAGR